MAGHPGRKIILLLQQFTIPKFSFIEVRVNVRLLKLIRLFMQKVKTQITRVKSPLTGNVVLYLSEIRDTCKGDKGFILLSHRIHLF
jgi:hypothetical protein